MLNINEVQSQNFTTEPENISYNINQFKHETRDLAPEGAMYTKNTYNSLTSLIWNFNNFFLHC